MTSRFTGHGPGEDAACVFRIPAYRREGLRALPPAAFPPTGPKAQDALLLVASPAPASGARDRPRDPGPARMPAGPHRTDVRTSRTLSPDEPFLHRRRRMTSMVQGRWVAPSSERSELVGASAHAWQARARRPAQCSHKLRPDCIGTPLEGAAPVQCDRPQRSLPVGSPPRRDGVRCRPAAGGFAAASGNDTCWPALARYLS